MLQTAILADHEAVSQFAAQWLGELLVEQPDALICLASGSTPTRTYELLAQRAADNPQLLARARLLKLDEWGGLPPGDAATCEHHLRTVLIDPLNLSARYTAFDPQAADPAAECARIAAWLANHGPITACVLGLGVNGHLGFNEPADSLEPHAHVAQLSAASLAHAMVSRAGARPAFGMTLGMADIMHSQHILVLATGAAKRPPLEQLASGAITTTFPASMLHMHPSATLVCDEAACPPESRRRS